MIKEMKTQTAAQEKKLEDAVAHTKLAETVEHVVKQKLAKRLAQLQATGAKAVSDLTPQISNLKSRVRHLRRQQSRMQVNEATLQRDVSHASEVSQHRDLGESSSIASELQKMQLQQMMMRQQVQPPPQVPEEHAELMKLKQQMADMQQQNNMFRQMIAQQAHRATAPTHYTHNDLQAYFQNKKLADQAALRNEVLAEKQRLDGLATRLGTSQGNPLAGAQMLVEVEEGAGSEEVETAIPLYNQHAEQARFDMEELRNRAMEDMNAISDVQEEQRSEISHQTLSVVDELDE